MITGPLLNGFQAHPEHGTVLFPVINMARQDDPSAWQRAAIFERELTPVTLPEFRELTASLFRQARRLYHENGQSLPCPLPATDNRWSIDHFSNERQRLRFANSGGRSIDLGLWTNQFGALGLIQVGEERGAMRFNLGTVLYPDAVCASYEFLFDTTGVRGLRAVLGLSRDVPLYEVALAITNLIYASGHYDPLLKKFYISDYGPGRQVHPLEIDGNGQVRIPARLISFYESRSAFHIEGFRQERQYAMCEGLFLIMAGTDGVQENLELLLQSPARHGPQGLKPRMKEVIWDVAEILIRSAVVVSGRN